jgi:hypothetical protein
VRPQAGGILREAKTTVGTSMICPQRRNIINARCRERSERLHDIDDSDRFPAFTCNITSRDYSREFKSVGIIKYDGKKNPR